MTIQDIVCGTPRYFALVCPGQVERAQPVWPPRALPLTRLFLSLVRAWPLRFASFGLRLLAVVGFPALLALGVFFSL